MKDLEVWKDISGYDGVYQISTAGRIKKHYKTCTRMMSTFTKKNRKSRMYVNLTDKNGKQTHYSVTNLMVREFLDKPEGMCVYHKNGVLSDDWIGNLGFATQSDLGKIYGGKATRKPVAKINSDGEVVEVYPTIAKAAKENYLSVQCVSSRCSGRQIKHGGVVKEIKSLYAPDGYVYAWAEPKEIDKAIKRIRKGEI